MKKLGLFFATIALTMGTSFAQESKIALTPGQNDVSVVFQTGDSHQAGVVQNGMFNNSTILQQTVGNTANVTQTNFVGPQIPTNSEIKQEGPMNVAVVEQVSTGVDNLNSEVLELFAPLTATIYQAGPLNTAMQTQYRFANTATIKQWGAINYAEQNQDVEMDADYTGSFNTATIYQTGNENSAIQSQYGWLNVALIEQPGNGNKATQSQDLYSSGNSAFAQQTGNNNESTQTQVGFLNNATVYQSSDENVAEQDQSSLSFATLDAENSDGLEIDFSLNKGTIVQEEGDGNIALQIQNNGLRSVLNEAYTLQHGEANLSSQTQDGGANYSLIQQKGSGMDATVWQTSCMRNPL